MNCTACPSYNRGHGQRDCLKCAKYRDILKKSVKRQTIRIDVAPQAILEQIADENPQVIGILDALQSLPPMLSAITAMVYVSGLTHQQIAEIMGVSRQTVSRKSKAALIRIRRAVRGEATPESASLKCQ